MKKILTYIIDYIRFVLQGGKCLFPTFLYKNILSDNIFIGRGCNISKCEIGRHTYMGNSCCFSNAKIGSFCSISQNVRMAIGRHPSAIYVSTSPLFYAESSYLGKGWNVDKEFKEYTKTDNGYSLEIGNDVWIGMNVTILEGVKIGDGAIVAACSCVVKDVPPYAIVGGVPAKIIRYRFTEEEIEILQKLKWWEWSEEEIKREAHKFSNVKNFCV